MSGEGQVGKMEDDDSGQSMKGFVKKNKKSRRFDFKRWKRKNKRAPPLAFNNILFEGK